MKALSQQLSHTAKTGFSKLVSEQDAYVEDFQHYGKNYIKSVGISPDAYTQMAIQLASYRLFRKQAGTYEAIQVRPYLHGRTETARTVSPASHAFVKIMGLQPLHDENMDNVRMEKIELLRQAADSHVKYTRNALRGQAVDRHLFGLFMLIRDGETPPVLFSHPLYLRSKCWRVTTSTLPYVKPAFGAVEPDGVAIGYEVLADSIYFTITGRAEHDWTGRLRELLEEALLEMKELLDYEANSKQ